MVNLIVHLINILLVTVVYQLYKRVPRTTGLNIEYFSNKLEDFDNIPTY